MTRPLSYLIGFLVVFLLAASIFAPAPGSRIVTPDKENDCQALKKHYQSCINTHPDVAPCEEIMALWVRCVKNQEVAGMVK